MSPPSNSTYLLVKSILMGNRRALARFITQIENDQTEALAALIDLYPHTGQAHLIGVTGAPGTGKSSLVMQLVKAYRQADKRVAVLAVDPTSPFSGGAILGDRIRMRDLAGDQGVFIRSMATRGRTGGLSQAISDCIDVLDAAGFDLILIETVGAGQSEVDIAAVTQTVIVVEAPGLGDDIQATKAGILEIADIIVVNKADRPEAAKTVATLKAALTLGHAVPKTIFQDGSFSSIEALPEASKAPIWQVPVLKTVAIEGEGLPKLLEMLQQHQDYLRQSGELMERNRMRLMQAFENHLHDQLWQTIQQKFVAAEMTTLTSQLIKRTCSPYQAALDVLRKIPL